MPEALCVKCGEKTTLFVNVRDDDPGLGRQMMHLKAFSSPRAVNGVECA